MVSRSVLVSSTRSWSAKYSRWTCCSAMSCRKTQGRAVENSVESNESAWSSVAARGRLDSKLRKHTSPIRRSTCTQNHFELGRSSKLSARLSCGKNVSPCTSKRHSSCSIHQKHRRNGVAAATRASSLGHAIENGRQWRRRRNQGRALFVGKEESTHEGARRESVYTPGRCLPTRISADIVSSRNVSISDKDPESQKPPSLIISGWALEPTQKSKTH